MKKIVGFFALILLMGCDDGDMTFKTFDFGSAAVQSCSSNSSLIYKVNGTEVLLLNIDPSYFTNAVNLNGTIVTLNAANTVVYRNYTGTVNSSVLCSSIPPATPTVQEEWYGTAGGTISIITTERRVDNVLTGYDHVIKLVDVTFNNNGQLTRIADNIFGTYTTELGYTFDFAEAVGEEQALAIEDCGTLVYKKNVDEALIFSLDPGSFPNTEGTTNIDLGLTTDANEVVFNVYSSTIVNAVLCDAIPPITPVVTEQWNATAGTLKIITSFTGGQFTYMLYLSNVTFTSDTSAGETIPIGAGTDYYLGVYIPTP